MRKDFHYVQSKLTSEQKEKFLRMARSSRLTNKATFLKMLEGRAIREFPPKGFNDVSKQLGDISGNYPIISKAAITDEERIKLFMFFHSFDQYIQLVRRSMIYIGIIGKDSYAEYPEKKNNKTEANK